MEPPCTRDPPGEHGRVSDIGAPTVAGARSGGRPATRLPDLRSFSLVALLVLASLYTLYFAREVVLPLVLASLLALLLSPVVSALGRAGIPRWAASTAVIVILLGGASLGVRSLVEPARVWISEAPEKFRELKTKMTALTEPVAEMDRASREVERLTGIGPKDHPPEVRMREPTLGETVLSETGELATGGALVLVLLLFLLASGDRFLRKLIRVLRTLEQKRTALRIARRVQSEVSRYLLTLLLINVGLGAAVAAAMALLGMPNPLLWGAMAACLNFVPYVGPLIGVSVVAAVALLTFDGLGHAVLPPLAYLGLNVVEGSVITPAVMSVRFALNPVAILVGLVFWGWLWGIPGVLLAVPMLATTKIFCDHYPPLTPLGIFLGR